MLPFLLKRLLQVFVHSAYVLLSEIALKCSMKIQDERCLHEAVGVA